MAKLLANQNLYRPDIVNYKNSLLVAKNLPKLSGKIIFHCLWRVPKEFERKQLAVIKSIIVSHIDNLSDLK